MGGIEGGLVLASGSPRRRELLGRLGMPVVTVVSGVAEEVEAGLAAEEVVVRVARQKAEAVAVAVGRGLVVGADTAVVAAGELVGKPRDDADARRMLRALGGRTHRVVTGLAVVDAARGRVEASAVATAVRMRAYDDEEIAAYVATGEPLDKAGGYGIQGGGGALVAAFEGCFTNVVGLPLCETAALLARFGVAPGVAGPVCTLPSGAPCPRLVDDPRPGGPGTGRTS